MTSIELDVQMLPPTPNQMRSAHWGKIKKIRDEAAWAVRKARLDAHIHHHELERSCTTPATIDVVIHAHGRAADSDNQWARCKPIIDALVHEGLLVDDSPRWLTLGSITHQKAPPRRGHITIRITYTEEVQEASA